MSDEQDMTIADYLRAAADELLVNGWTRGEFEDGDGRHCSLGAIKVAVEPSRWSPGPCSTDALAVARALADVIREAVPGGPMYGACSAVISWNDYYARSKTDAARALLIAADEWEARHAE